MTSRPILFSGPMVRALLAGTKTQTRRLIKVGDESAQYRLKDGWLQAYIGDGAHDTAFPLSDDDSWMGVQSDWEQGFRCPYGVPGDQLWVREAFGITARIPTSSWQRIMADRSAPSGWLSFRADEPTGNWCWKPSIHMPYWMCRITLEITDVRVQRLQEISEEDALAEGVTYRDTEYSATHNFRLLWESINGAGSWSENSWVWCISFKRLLGGPVAI